MSSEEIVTSIMMNTDGHSTSDDAYRIYDRVIAPLLADAEQLGAIRALRAAAADIPGLPRDGFIYSVRLGINRWLVSRADELQRGRR